MTATYEKIASTTLANSTTNSVSFSSISGSYTDIVAVLNFGAAQSSTSVSSRVNSDTGTNYSTTWLVGNGSAASSGRFSNETWMIIGQIYNPVPTTLSVNMLVQFQNYSNTTTYKTVLSRFNDAANETNATVSLWRNTVAINNISFFCNNAAHYFLTGSTFTLYGIKAE